MALPLLRMEIRHEHDVVLVRQRARQIAAALKFDSQDQTRIATALSEVARNAFQYAGGGLVEFQIETPPAAALIHHRERQGARHREPPTKSSTENTSHNRHGAGNDWGPAIDGRIHSREYLPRDEGRARQEPSAAVLRS